MYDNVSIAAESIMHLEKEWSKSELVRRVVRYINRQELSPDNASKEWPDLVEALIGGSMQAYTSACGDKPWFHDLDLAPSFAAAAWAFLSTQPGKSVRDLPRWLDFKDVVVDVCEGKLDDARTTNAHWDTCKACFSDQSAQAKVERALSKSYQPSLDECLMDTRPLEPIK